MVMKAEEITNNSEEVTNSNDTFSTKVTEAEISQSYIKVNDLPSRYLPYKNTDVSIWIKPYNFRELEKLEMSKSNEQEILPVLIALNKSDSIKLVGIDSIEDLDFIDFLYINMLRKIITFDENSFNLENFDCPYCKKHINKITLDCRVFNFAEIEKDVESLPIYYNLLDGTEIECSTLTVRKALELNLSNNTDSMLTRLSYKITNFSQKEAYDLLSNITNGEDLVNLQVLNALTDIDNNYVELDCPHCKKKINVRVPEVLNLAIPFCRQERLIKPKFRFNKN